LFKAVGVVFDKHEMPERRAHELDNCDTNFFVALHWAKFLAEEGSRLTPIFENLCSASKDVVDEVYRSQGTHIDLGGYYMFDCEKAKLAMNPSHPMP
jgi:isocitrate dehydrogenase